jgi:predicted acyltransferase
LTGERRFFQEDEMTVLHLIAAGLAVLAAALLLGYAAWLYFYALRDDEVVRERLRQVTQ